MRVRIFYLLLSVFTVFLSSCNEDPIEPEERIWDKFIGTYNVTKLENGDSYQMTISHIGSEVLENEAILDSLQVVNYGDLFDLVIYFGSNGGYSDERVFIPIGGNPISDKFDERWAFWVNAPDTTTEELENTLVDDTMLLYFGINNVAYYIDDGVPFYECECKPLAVKIA